MAWHKPQNLGDWLDLLLRHKKKIFFPSIAVMIGVVIWGLMQKREYQGLGKIYRRNDLAMQATGGGLVGNQLSTVRSQSTELLKGRPAIEELITSLKLVEEMKIPRDPADNSKFTPEGQMQYNGLVAKLAGGIRVWHEINTYDVELIDVSFTDNDPALVPRVVDQVMENYISRVSNEMDRVLNNTQSFFQQQVTNAKDKTRRYEEERITFQQDHQGMTVDDPLNPQMRWAELQKSYDVLHGRCVEAEGSLETMRKKFAEMPEFITREERGAPAAISAKMNTKLQLEADLEAKRGSPGHPKDSHPDIIALKQRIAALQKEIDKNQDKQEVVKSERVPNDNRELLSVQIEALAGQVGAMKKQLAAITGEMDHWLKLKRNYIANRNEFLQIESNLADARESGRFWVEQLRKVQVAIESDQAKRGVQLYVHQRADKFTLPSQPTTNTILMYACIAGVAVALGMVLLAELMDRSYRNVDQAVDDLKLPVLGAVNEIVTPPIALRRNMLGRGLYPAMGALLLLALAVSFWLLRRSLADPLGYQNLIRSIRSLFHL